MKKDLLYQLESSVTSDMMSSRPTVHFGVGVNDLRQRMNRWKEDQERGGQTLQEEWVKGGGGMDEKADVGLWRLIEKMEVKECVFIVCG